MTAPAMKIIHAHYASILTTALTTFTNYSFVGTCRSHMLSNNTESKCQIICASKSFIFAEHAKNWWMTYPLLGWAATGYKVLPATSAIKERLTAAETPVL